MSVVDRRGLSLLYALGIAGTSWPEAVVPSISRVDQKHGRPRADNKDKDERLRQVPTEYRRSHCPASSLTGLPLVFHD
jgi:hypothetical protein